MADKNDHKTGQSHYKFTIYYQSAAIVPMRTIIGADNDCSLGVKMSETSHLFFFLP